MEKAGFIGLGIMGKPMAHNLLKAGVDLTVCDLNQDAVNELTAAGAKSGSYKEIGESCDIILTICPTAQSFSLYCSARAALRKVFPKASWYATCPPLPRPKARPVMSV